METTKKNNFKLQVEIWSDVICPFCYIGKRKFEKALEQFPYRDNINVIWKSFQLDPFAVTDPTLNTMEHLSRKKGWSAKQTNDSTAYITGMAKQAGLDYHFEKAIVANSFNAHRLSHLAKKYGKQNELEEKLFAAYFTEGKNTDDYDTLLQMGISVGLDEKEVSEVLKTDAYSDEVKHDIAHANQIDVRGVPYFLIDDKYAISGAQDEAIFLQTLNKAYSEHKEPDIIEVLLTDNYSVCGPEGCEV